MRTLLLLAIVFPALALTGGCGDTGPTRSPAVGDDTTAADVVVCAGRIADRGDSTGTYDDGEAFDSPDEALASAVASIPLVGDPDDLQAARSTADRVLYTYDVDGRTVEAVVVRNGPTIDDDGWYPDSWARCDLAELPAAVTDATGTEVWQDADGSRVDTRTIQSYAGPEHCDWQAMTFLEVGRATYVRDPEVGLEDFFAEAWDPSATLPADAHDTGYERDGAHLWLSHDRQRAFVGDAGAVEMWPREQQPIGCA